MALFLHMVRQEQVKLIQWKDGKNRRMKEELSRVHSNMYLVQSKEHQEFNFVYVQVT
jgi:hypothetical protein